MMKNVSPEMLEIENKCDSKNLIDELSEFKIFARLFKVPAVERFVSGKKLVAFLNHRTARKICNYEVMSYLFFGLAATVVSFGTFIIFSAIFKSIVYNHGSNFGITEITNTTLATITLVANIISISCAVAFQYYTNSKWVFRSKHETKKSKWAEFFRFLSARMATIILEMITVPLLVLYGFPDLGSKIFITVFVVILNYFLSKILVFKTNKE
jgi:putative flippase GtrA